MYFYPGMTMKKSALSYQALRSRLNMIDSHLVDLQMERLHVLAELPAAQRAAEAAAIVRLCNAPCSRYRG